MLNTGCDLKSSIAQLLSDKLNGFGHFMLCLLHTAISDPVDINVNIKIA